MKCPSEIELNEYAENRLSTERRWEIQQHLAQCAGCRADLEGLERITGNLALLNDPAELAALPHPSEHDLAELACGTLPADKRPEIISHLSSCPECARLFGELPREKKRLFTLPRHWHIYSAVAALLIAIGVFFMSGGPGSQILLPGSTPAPITHNRQETTASHPLVPPSAPSALPAPPQQATKANTTALKPAAKPVVTEAKPTVRKAVSAAGSAHVRPAPSPRPTKLGVRVPPRNNWDSRRTMGNRRSITWTPKTSITLDMHSPRPAPRKNNPLPQVEAPILPMKATALGGAGIAAESTTLGLPGTPWKTATPPQGVRGGAAALAGGSRQAMGSAGVGTYSAADDSSHNQTQSLSATEDHNDPVRKTKIKQLSSQSHQSSSTAHQSVFQQHQEQSQAKQLVAKTASQHDTTTSPLGATSTTP